jgi:hypothetical protein
LFCWCQAVEELIDLSIKPYPPSGCEFWGAQWQQAVEAGFQKELLTEREIVGLKFVSGGLKLVRSEAMKNLCLGMKAYDSALVDIQRAVHTLYSPGPTMCSHPRACRSFFPSDRTVHMKGFTDVYLVNMPEFQLCGLCGQVLSAMRPIHVSPQVARAGYPWL